MGSITIIPNASTPAERILSRFDRGQLAGFIEVAIGLLDLADGDADSEDGEVDSGADDRADDPAWIEWHTRGPRKIDAFNSEVLGRDWIGNTQHEDDEDGADREPDENPHETTRPFNAGDYQS